MSHLIDSGDDGDGWDDIPALPDDIERWETRRTDYHDTDDVLGMEDGPMDGEARSVNRTDDVKPLTAADLDRIQQRNAPGYIDAEDLARLYATARAGHREVTDDDAVWFEASLNRLVEGEGYSRRIKRVLSEFVNRGTACSGLDPSSKENG